VSQMQCPVTIYGTWDISLEYEVTCAHIGICLFERRVEFVIIII